MTSKPAPTPPSPYSTGGGGTVLEHQYAAVLLSHLLTGDPVPGLGGDARLQSVHLQARVDGPVDDFFLVGRTPDGDTRHLSIGVRRAPKLTSTDTETAELLKSYVQALAQDWTALSEGRALLALAVSNQSSAPRQLGRLSEIAKSCRSDAEFRRKVARPGETNSAVRDRLTHVDALVKTAHQKTAVKTQHFPAEELTWRLLSVLRVLETRLQDGDDTDRIHAIARLRNVVPDGTATSAQALFARLYEQVGQYGPTGATVTDTSLRRDLAGTPLMHSTNHAKAWRFLASLIDRLRIRTRTELRDRHNTLILDRSAAHEALTSTMATAATQTAALIVTGEPGVGKSSLALQAAQNLAASGCAVTSLSLRDLPQAIWDLEERLGGNLVDVLGASAVGQGRLLVLDGCESALEGRDQLLVEVATAALSAGLGVVCVTRADGRTQVASCLGQAYRATGRTGDVEEHEVPKLEPSEVDRIAETFPILAGPSGEPRTAWILAQPALVDLLLRSGSSLNSQPLVSEADVLKAVWRSWVRGGEVAGAGGVTPDDRERAMLWLARRELGIEPAELPSSLALASLRSDGLFLGPGVTSSWHGHDEFATDIIKDFAVAFLLFTRGLDLLVEADGSRWALRATRLACQLHLAEGGDARTVLRRLRVTLQTVANRHGQRWAELPWEALLTFRSAQSLMATVWSDLIADDRAGLRTAMRLALQRHVRGGIGEPVVLEPLVALAFCGQPDLGPEIRFGGGEFAREVQQVVLAYLNGLVFEGAPIHQVRQEVRNTLLARYAPAREEFVIEALAVLGPDLDDRVEAFFMDLVDRGGFELAPAVEDPGAAAAMGRHQPELLLTLTEAYYVDRDEDGRSFEGGIRAHHVGTGFGEPSAAWFYGPFFHLLSARPALAIALINRMLDHAAVIEATPRSFGLTAPAENEAAEALDLDLLGEGQHRYIGNSRVWCWYRGSSDGPWPCMSALLAVERFADHLVDDLGVPLADVARALLRGCGNLAMPALVVGLFVRRLEAAGELLDRWLGVPELWRLESARVAHEAFMHVQGQDAPDVIGRARRRTSFNMVAEDMTVHALLAQDAVRLGQLEEIGEELLRQADRDGVGAIHPERRLVEIWASLFRAENYHEFREGATTYIQYEHPTHIAKEIASTLSDLADGQEALRLQNTYAPPDGPPKALDSLVEDIAIARRLATDPPRSGPLHAADPVAAVAATAILAAAELRVELSQDDLRWAAQTIIDEAISPLADTMITASTTYPMGADRTAAAALPALLVPPFDSLEIGRSRLLEALASSSTSGSDEVRLALADGMHAVWATRCVEPGPVPCHHELLWNIAQAGLQDCRLGSWDPRAGQRPPLHLPGPYEQTLPATPTEDLLLNRLAAPIVAAAAAACVNSCISATAGQLLEVLVETQSRVALHYSAKRYGRHTDRQPQAVASALVEASTAGKPEALAAYLAALCSDEAALSETLRNLARIFTYDEALRKNLLAQWRQIMTVVLDAAEAGTLMQPTRSRRHTERAVSMLLPTPQIDNMDPDIDATLTTARMGWIDPNTIADLFVRWLPFARQDPHSVDAVAQLARCAPRSWQLTTGLTWAELVIDGNFGSVARRCYFVPGWLEELAVLPMSTEERERWRRIVDGLAAAGDRRIVALQKADE